MNQLVHTSSTWIHETLDARLKILTERESLYTTSPTRSSTSNSPIYLRLILLWSLESHAPFVWRDFQEDVILRDETNLFAMLICIGTLPILSGHQPLHDQLYNTLRVLH